MYWASWVFTHMVTTIIKFSCEVPHVILTKFSLNVPSPISSPILPWGFSQSRSYIWNPPMEPLPPIFSFLPSLGTCSLLTRWNSGQESSCCLNRRVFHHAASSVLRSYTGWWTMWRGSRRRRWASTSCRWDCKVWFVCSGPCDHHGLSWRESPIPVTRQSLSLAVLELTV